MVVKNEMRHVIRSNYINGAFYIKEDRYIVLSKVINIRDLFEVLVIDKNKVKIRYSFLPKYYINEIGNRIRITEDDNSVFKLIKKDNGSYVFISNMTHLALTISNNREIILSKYNENNPNQEFIIQCISF